MPGELIPGRIGSSVARHQLLRALSSLCLAAIGSPAWAAAPPFKFLRYEEDYAYLADPARRTSAWEALKYIPLAGGYLSLGGDGRERFEAYRHEFFSNAPNADNAYLLQRYLAHVDYHPAKGARVFGQLQSSLEDGRAGGPRPADRDIIDLHQLFVELTATGEAGRLSLRLGRQEMSLGSERLVSVREGPNNRRAFEAVRLAYAKDRLVVDAFYSSPVEIDRGAFDDGRVDSQRFWGAYATLPLSFLPHASADVYYLGFENTHASFNRLPARERRHTVGVRFFGRSGDFDFNHEFAYQFGEMGGAEIVAWGAALDFGFTMREQRGKPRWGLKAAIATGEGDPSTKISHAHNPLFPRGNYFTEAGLLGPKNFFDLHPGVRIQPLNRWTLDAGIDFYWRQNLADGIYSGGGAPIYPGHRAFSRFVGTDVSVLADWQATSRLRLTFGYTHFFAGAFIRQNHGLDVDFTSAQVTVRF